MARRGPDAQIGWANARARAGIGLAHARLSVIEPSDDGPQPMTSASGHFVMIYKGEIYSALEIQEGLRAELGRLVPNIGGI